jgi:ketosteroid isomerase-like protein
MAVSDTSGAVPRGDSAQVAATVEAYHQALAGEDEEAALALLAPDVRVLEDGHVQDLDAYRDEHLPADMDFASSVSRRQGPIQVTVRGDVAWTVATSQSSGSYRGRGVDARGAELMVLARDEQGAWRIEAIHWSFR